MTRKSRPGTARMARGRLWNRRQNAPFQLPGRRPICLESAVLCTIAAQKGQDKAAGFWPAAIPWRALTYGEPP